MKLIKKKMKMKKSVKVLLSIVGALSILSIIYETIDTLFMNNNLASAPWITYYIFTVGAISLAFSVLTFVVELWLPKKDELDSL